MKKTKLGQAIIAGLNDAISFEKGKKILKTTIINIPDPAPKWDSHDIVHIRKKIFGVSQPIFASILSVTASTVRAWEQGLKKPSGAASRLIQILKSSPDVLQGLKYR